MMEKIITLQDKRYPKLLKEIKDRPKKLYYKGNWDSEIFENCLAVVGSRRMTSYGKRVVQEIVSQVAAVGVTIVSGFMYGIDVQAHKASLKAGGRTIAVMPCGIDLIHPEDQKDLYLEILNNKGLVISEYEGGFLPGLWTYPRRNRIVAGLSKAALIVEAGLKSGSLITANFARQFGRKVFAIPGPITSETSKGTLQLLKEGAGLVTSAKDILEFYRSHSVLSSRFIPPFPGEGREPYASQKVQNARVTGQLEKQIIEQLQREPLDIDTLARTLGIPASKLGTILSLMQLKDFISQESGKYHAN